MASDNTDASCFLQARNRYKRFFGVTLLILTSKEMKHMRLNILPLFPAFILLTIFFLEKPFTKF